MTPLEKKTLVHIKEKVKGLTLHHPVVKTILEGEEKENYFKNLDTDWKQDICIKQDILKWLDALSDE